MEIKIGVQFAPREIVIESKESQDEVAEKVSHALENDGGLLTLVDERGQRVLVPTEKLAYVEIGEASQRKVGFSPT